MAYHPNNVEVPVADTVFSERRTDKGLVTKVVIITPEQTAEAIARMDYSSQAVFFSKYCDQIKAQSKKDASIGRVQLPERLDYIAGLSSKVSIAFTIAWNKICAKYMSRTEGGYNGK